MTRRRLTPLTGFAVILLLLPLLMSCHDASSPRPAFVAPNLLPAVLGTDALRALENLNRQLGGLDADDPQLAANLRELLDTFDTSLTDVETKLDTALRDAIASICAHEPASAPPCRPRQHLLRRWLNLALEIASVDDDCSPPLSINWDWHLLLLNRALLAGVDDPLDEAGEFYQSIGNRLDALEISVSYHQYYGRELCAIRDRHLDSLARLDNQAQHDTARIENVLASLLGVNRVAGAALDRYAAAAAPIPFRITTSATAAREAADDFVRSYIQLDTSTGTIAVAEDIPAGVPDRLGRYTYQSVGGFVVRFDHSDNHHGHQDAAVRDPARHYLSAVLPYFEEAIAAACREWMSTNEGYQSGFLIYFGDTTMSDRIRLREVADGVPRSDGDLERTCRTSETLRTAFVGALDEYWNGRLQEEKTAYAHSYDERFWLIDSVYRNAMAQTMAGRLLGPEEVSKKLIGEWVAEAVGDRRRQQASYDEVESRRVAHARAVETMKLQHASALEQASLEWANTRAVESIRANTSIETARIDLEARLADYEIRLRETLDTNRANLQIAETNARSVQAVARMQADATIKAARIARKQAVLTSVINGVFGTANAGVTAAGGVESATVTAAGNAAAAQAGAR